MSDAREKFLTLVKSKGWTPDPTKTISKSRYDRDTRVQDPYSFIKPATAGGHWAIHLDYTQNNGWSGLRYGTTLREVTVRWILPDVEQVNVPYYDNGPMHLVEGKSATLRNNNTSKYKADSDLWTALEDENKELSLRKRAEFLVSDPDLVIWLGAKAQHEREIREAEAEARRQADRAARAQELPVTVTQNHAGSRYGSEWGTMTRALTWSAKGIDTADGKSDLPALVAKAKKDLDTIIAALTPEAREAMEALLTEEVSA